ncbi:putative ribonuclease H-like domain-containing protein [Tanacetum coccineum]
MNELCAKKGIKREFSVARTPQQNGVVERKYRTLIEAARTMLADSLLPIAFWEEAVNTACYVLNKVLVTKPQNKTPYELLIDEGYLLGYSTTSKAFGVYNKRTKRVEENMHIDFLENQPNVAGSGPVGCLSEKDKEPTQEYILLSLYPHRPRISVEDVVQAAQEKPSEDFLKDNDVQDSEDVTEKEEQHMLTEADQALKDDLEPSVSTSNLPLVSTANTPYASAASTPTGANTDGSSFVYLGGQIPIDAFTLSNADFPIDPNMPDLEDDSNTFPNDGIFSGAYDNKDVGVHKDHLKGQILGDPKSAVQTRGKIQKASLKVWILVDLPYGKKAIDTKWVYKNKRDERSIVVKNKARLVAQGFRQEEGIDYDEVFAPIARIEAIMLFLAFASFMGFPVYQMDVKSAFLYGTIREKVYVHQPPGFVNPAHPNKVYKVIKALYGLHQALICTDIAKIKRKEPKPDKNGHGTERVHKRRESINNGQQKSTMVNIGQLM